jgi:hypothetical protein
VLLYQVLHAVDRSYTLAVFWVYVAAFLLTFTLIFIFPPAAIVMVFVALLGLGIAVAGGKLIGLSARLTARSFLQRGRCPRCDEPIESAAAGHGVVSTRRCHGCGACFLPSGAEPEPSPASRDEGTA